MARGLAIDLEGRTAVVTGGSRGIGRETVLLLARAGCRVAFFYRSDRHAAGDCAAAARDAGAEVLAIRADVSREREVARAVARVRRAFGPVEILVNNAGIWPGGAIEKLSVEEWDEAFAVNVRGTFLPIKHTLSGMKSRGRGRIVNVSSTAGQRGEAFHSHYAATKGAIISLTKSLAAELSGTGITVNAVAPGWVDTDMAAEHLQGPRGAAILRDIPLGRVATARELGRAVAWLALDAPESMTGCIIDANGASYLRT